MEEPAVEDQPSAFEERQALNPTLEQELQQLQAQLQSMQQESVTAVFATNQRATQTSAQAAEIKQQLAVLQAEIQSMQPS